MLLTWKIQFKGQVYVYIVNQSSLKPSPNECSGYGIKQPDGEAPVMQELWEYSFNAIASWSTLVRGGST